MVELIIDLILLFNFIGCLVVEVFGGGDEEFDLKLCGMVLLCDVVWLFLLYYKFNCCYLMGGCWDEF